jgi:hypothetical protein
MSCTCLPFLSPALSHPCFGLGMFFGFERSVVSSRRFAVNLDALTFPCEAWCVSFTQLFRHNLKMPQSL